MKLNMDSRSINNFFFHHIEKLVLAVVLVAVVGVIYLRVGRPGFDENQSPDKLQQVAVTARNNIQSTTWDQVKSETKRTTRGDYDRRVKETQRNAESTPYSVDVPWDKPLGRPGARRSDPEVLKAELLEVSAVVGPIAVRGDSKRHRLLQLEDAPPKKEKKSRKEKDKDRGPANDPDGDPGDDEYEYDDGDPADGGLGGGGPTAAGGSRKVPKSKVCGYRPGSSGDMAGGDMGGGLGPSSPGGMSPGRGRGNEDSGANEQIVPAPAALIAVKALFPFKKQHEIYKKAFADAVGYSPSRDRVDILFAYLQRADVTDDPTKELKDEDFSDVKWGHTNSYKALEKTKKWAGIPIERVDLAFVNPNTTLPCPPLMLRCLDDFMLHSKSPKVGTVQKITSASDEENKDAEDIDDEPSNEPGAEPSANSGPGGYYGGEGLGGSGDGLGDGDDGGMGAGMMGGGADGMSGYGGSRRVAIEEIEYKLVRMYDLTAEPGKVYRYRIRVLLRDPNNPNPTDRADFKKPSRRHMAKEVIERLTKQEAAAKKAGKKTIPFWLDSGWSDASPAISLPSPNRVAVGPVTSARRVTSPTGASSFVRWERSGPSGTAVPIVWDPSYATDLSTEKAVTRGSVLDALVDSAEVIEPVSLIIKEIKDAKIISQLVVIDIAGGDSLPTTVRKEKLASAGEYLLLTADGSLVVHNELDDMKDFSLYRFDFKAEISDGGGGDMGGFGNGPSGSGGPSGGLGGGPGVNDN